MNFEKFFKKNKLSNKKIEELMKRFPDNMLVQEIGKEILKSETEWFRVHLANILMDYAISEIWTDVWEKHKYGNQRKAENIANQEVSKFVKKYL